MFLADLKLRNKLYAGFGAVVAVIAVSSGYLYANTTAIFEIERSSSISDKAVDSADKLNSDLLAARAAVRKLVLTGDAADRTEMNAALAQHARDLGALKADLGKEAPDLLSLVASYEAAVDEFAQRILQVEANLASSPTTRQQAAEMVASKSSAPYAGPVVTDMAQLREGIDRWSDTVVEAGNAATSRGKLVIALSGLLSTLLAGFMAWLIGRAVATPVGAMTDAMQSLARGDHAVTVPAMGRRDEIGAMAAAVQIFRDAAIEKLRLEADALSAGRLTEQERTRNAAALAESAARQASVVEAVATGLSRLSGGDLGHRIEEPFPADYERLRTDFNGAMAKLQGTLRLVATRASTISAGTGEISTASDDLSRRTEQQASSLEETAAALEEITSTVRKTAEGSRHARAVVGRARDDAEKSGQVVRQAVEAMSGIERSSREIGQIIGVIDEIAFQTNLLALNAGVEAARAGEAGRGFAVVASEVRALAQRSADAAKEIKGLISTSSAQVEKGVDYVGQTGDALTRIVAQVAEIDGIVGEIAASAQEQATGLDQVNTAVNQMDQVTQQNATMVEQAKDASQALAGETGELARLIGEFRLGSGDGAPQAAPRPKPRAAAPVRMLRQTGRGGAALKPQASAEAEGWGEF